MKKTFIFVLVNLFCVTISFAEYLNVDNSNMFVKYFDKSYKNADFLIHNPMFYNESDNQLFVKLDSVKNKIFVTKRQGYYLADDGTKYESDADGWTIYYEYYVFNKQALVMLIQIKLLNTDFRI